MLHRKISDSTAINFVNYVYDPVGNKTAAQDINGSHNYGYDDLHRLTGADHHGASSVETKAEMFEYDPVGNRLADANMTGYVYDAANRLTENSSFTYTYDAEGNLTRQTERTTGAQTDYTYNSQNQLVRVDLADGRVVAIKYDDDNRRIEKSVTSGAITIMRRYLYDKDSNVVAILDGNNNLVQLFTNGPGINQPFIMKSAADNKTYYYQQGLFGPAAITDETGGVIERMEYSSYGEPVITDANGTKLAASSVGNTFLYTGNEYDAETGQYNMQYRLYDPKIGRLTSADPIGRKGGDENLYVYVLNNPMAWIDPLGLCYITPEEGQRIVDEAAKWQGTEYARIGPLSIRNKKGDCSGSTWLIYNKAGFDYGGYRDTTLFPSSDRFGEVTAPQVGDVIWWPKQPGYDGHMAIYAGKDKDDNDIMWTALSGRKLYKIMPVKYWKHSKSPRYYRFKKECPK